MNNNKNQFNKIIGIFYKYSTNIAIILSKEKTIYYFEKDSFIEVFVNQPIDYTLLPKQLITTGPLLKDFYDKYHIMYNKKEAILIFDTEFNFLGEWTVKRLKKESIFSQFDNQSTILKSYQKISLDKKPFSFKSTQYDTVLSEQIKRQIDHELNKSRISLSALESLAIPMMAINIKDTILFQNKDWKTFYKVWSHTFNINTLLSEAKKKVVQHLLTNNDCDMVMKIDTVSDEYTLYCSVMYTGQDSIAGNNKQLGYLFWSILNKDSSIYLQNLSQNRTTQDIQSNDPHSDTKIILEIPYEILKKKKNFTDIVTLLEKKVLHWGLKYTNSNKTQASNLLGLPRQTFNYKLKKYNLL